MQISTFFIDVYLFPCLPTHVLFLCNVFSCSCVVSLVMRLLYSTWPFYFIMVCTPSHWWCAGYYNWGCAGNCLVTWGPFLVFKEHCAPSLSFSFPFLFFPTGFLGNTTSVNYILQYTELISEPSFTPHAWVNKCLLLFPNLVYLSWTQEFHYNPSCFSVGL